MEYAINIAKLAVAIPLACVDVITYILSFQWVLRILANRNKKQSYAVEGSYKGPVTAGVKTKGRARRRAGAEGGLLETIYDGDAKVSLLFIQCFFV